MIFDAHAHYDDPAFDPDRERLLDSLPEKGVGIVINAGSNLSSSLSSVRLAEKYDYIYAAVGIHPEYAEEWNDSTEKELKALVTNGKVVAIGEIGLDYHYDDAPSREDQKKTFRHQLDFAAEWNLPVVIHERDALSDTLEIISGYCQSVKMVFHCFSGSLEIAKELTSKGIYISLGGVVTFKNSRKAPLVLAGIPFDKLLTETDCPYMAPVPFRGNRCDSSMISSVIRKGSELRSVSEELFSKTVYQNGLDFFALKQNNR